MNRAGENVHLLSQFDVHKTGVSQHPVPLCFQQSAGNSARPQIDIVFCLLRHLDVHDDVSDL